MGKVTFRRSRRFPLVRVKKRLNEGNFLFFFLYIHACIFSVTAVIGETIDSTQWNRSIVRFPKRKERN